MIDRINNYNLDKYNNVNNLTKSSGGDTGFSLDMAEDGGVIFEPSGKDENKKKSENADAVTLELSTDRNVKKEQERKNNSNINKEKEVIDAGSNLVDDMLGMVKSAFNTVKSFFQIIINAFIPEDQQNKNMQAESEITDVKENAYSEDDIKNILKSGDSEELKKVITDNGNKILARSTTLSTLYDRKGRRMAMQVDKREEEILTGEEQTVEQFLKRI